VPYPPPRDPAASLPQDSCVFLSSASHSCVQSVGVTNSITTPNCACLVAPPPVLRPPTPSPPFTPWFFISFSRFHRACAGSTYSIYMVWHGICERALLGLWTVDYESLSVSEPNHDPLPVFCAAGHSRFVSPRDLIVFCHTSYPFWGVSCSKLKLTDRAALVG